MKKTTLIIAIIITILLLPLIYKKKGNLPLRGPDLSEFQYTDISFKNSAENIELGGMLMLPENTSSYPVAVLIHGSGPSHRNSVWYLSVAKHLTENGIAVLLPDKRGCEKSEGEWLGVSFELLANDALACIEYLKQDTSLQYTKIGLIGMSQGGWIAPIAATKSDDIDFIVSMAGSTVTTNEQLLHEEIYNISPYTYEFIAKQIAPITSKKILKMPHVKASAGFDPIPFWKQVEEPVFIALGENDTNVPVEQCIERLKEHKLDSRFKIKVYPDGGHAIRDPKTDKVSELYLNDLVDFIK
ncbi:alpha/beta hydrolase family protein [Marinifilum caeruleilacunae]|uniref:Alpha/beta fold hydrolase n=1 Tax=Marinifilum caeruleilacunae TaxID=2499076 RepID=A0ABX1WZX5_9BACT|nr:alpha/beta fold hydrolase [Marinifilum caeruleilacunae]NOU61691.1 alpha/beta fold hydrolase [Marinifilum caeruleilacunae]